MTTTSSSDTGSLFTKFRFTNGNGSGSSSGSKPPPLPPKDPVYLQQRNNAANRSAVDIYSPDSPMSSSAPRGGLGASPYTRANTNSPTFNHPNPNSPFQMGAALESSSIMNRSTTSLASQIPGQQHQHQQQPPPTPGPSNLSGAGSSSSSNRNQSGSKKALTAFLKFPKKSPRSPNGPNGNGDDEIPPPPQEDEGISMPWNFQHNIHVNETYDGLPPSWSISLASAGFSDDEIGAIQARRIAGGRSPPDLRYLYNERPLTPAAATAFNTPWGAAAVFTPPGGAGPSSLSSQPPAQFATTSNGVPILTNPTPRSTSLGRGTSSNPNTPGLSTSAPSGSFADQQNRPPVPTIPHQLSNSSSNPSIRSAAAGSINARKPPPTRRPPSPTEPELNRSVNGYAGYGGGGSGSGYGHKPNQPSGSTFTSSEDDMSNHDHADHTFSNMNDSVAYRINPEDEPPPPLPLSTHRPIIPGTRSRTGSNASQSRHGHSHSSPLVQYGHPHAPGHSASHSIAHSLSTSQTSHSNMRSHDEIPVALHPLRIGSESELSVSSGSSGHKGAMTMGMVLMSKSMGMDGSKDSDAGTVLGVPVSVSGSVSTLEGYGNGLAGGGRKWKVVNADTTRRSEETADDSGVAMVGAGAGINDGGAESSKEKEKTISKKPSLWGTKIPKTKSKAKLKPGAGNEGEDAAVPGVPVANMASASSTNLLPGPSSSSSHGNHSASGHGTGSGTAFSSFKSSTSQLAASTSSSLAAAGNTLAGKSQLLVGAVWSGAGKVGGKLRGSIKDKEGGKVKAGKDKGKDKVAADEKGKEKAQGFMSPGSDEEFISMAPDVDDGVDKVPVAPVWQLYMRSTQDLVEKEQHLGVNNPANKSSTSLASKPSQSQLRGKDPYGGLVDMKAGASSSTSSLHSEKSATQRIGGQHPSTSQTSLHSLKPQKMGHKANTSISSLNSIPEVASPTVQNSSMTSNNAASSSSTSLSLNNSQTPDSSPEKSRPPPAIKRTAALPPRLSLHKSATSSDLTSWSQALLSGISLSGSGDDDFAAGLGLGLGFGLGKEEKRKSDKLDLSFNGDFLNLSKKSEEEEEDDQTDDARQPRSAPASAATTAKPYGFAHHQAQPSVSSIASGSGSLRPPAEAPATAPTTPVQARSRRSGAAHLPASKPAPPMALPPPPLPQDAKQVGKPNGIQTLPHLRTDSLSKEGVGSKSAAPFSPLNLTKNTAIMSSLSGAMSGSLPLQSTQAVPPSVDPSSLLSPPPTAWTTQSPAAMGVNVISPSVHSSAGPDSAQLWNEIERMVSDVDLSTLPPGAQGVLRSAGVVGGFSVPSPLSVAGRGNVPPRLPLINRSRSAGSVSATDQNESLSSRGNVVILQNGNGRTSPKTVGELVGDSPTSEDHEHGRFSRPAYSETFSPTLPVTPEAARMAAANAKSGKQGHQKSKSVFEEQQMSHSRKQSPSGLRVPERAINPLDRNGVKGDDDDADSGSDYGDNQNPLQDDDDTYDYGPPPPLPPKTTPINVKPFPTLNHSRQPSDHLSVSGDLLDDDYRNTQRDSSRSSSSTLTMTGMAAVTIVRKASVARRTSAYFTQVPGPGTTPANKPQSGAPESKQLLNGHYAPSSPLSSYFGSSEDSGSSSSPSMEQPMVTPTSPDGTGTLGSSLDYYLHGAQTPSATPDQLTFNQPPPINVYRVNGERYQDNAGGEGYPMFPSEEEIETFRASGSPGPLSKPTIVISNELLEHSEPGMLTAATPLETPLSPFQRYRGWLSAVVAPLEEFIDEAVDPRDHYLDLREIAEGESGSVYAATLNPSTAHKLRLPPLVKAKDNDDILNGRTTFVAIKSVAIVPAGSPKLVDLQRELSLMRGLGHENVLGMDGVYVDLVEDSLWVRMELMERSLADIVQLIGGGFMLQDRMIARFASDVLHALVYLQEHNIAHRDVRSDNLLLNKHGILKLADFSNAVQVSKDDPNRTENVGVVFWQAPEIRRQVSLFFLLCPNANVKLLKCRPLPYNALKVDVWSLGATVWEMAQTEPPFSDTGVLAERWPPLTQPSLYSPAFHDFLRKTSDPAASRPRPMDLMTHSFINNACGRPVIVQLLSQCLTIESQQLEES
ncbi:hypothetical protein CVT24_001500 [Panaeolus cyanescens]|uniref:Non-specific serine/threonine protein kinase n=1 Tax=Panaeolus cyanescens TaxID=181874 RepID=A0A409YFB2_9AGAR|nr:hypothetical protein CVT24_001500 [Panaeolus cyanescens]